MKEVDQCFAELGRQMQRESKARHDFENKLHEDIKNTEIQLEIKAKIEKLENAVKENQKVIHAPSFKLLKSSRMSSTVEGLDLTELDKMKEAIDCLENTMKRVSFTELGII